MPYTLKWDETGKKRYQTGTKMAALFIQNADGTYNHGVAWSGMTGVTESPSGAEATDLWADDIKYLSIRSAEQFGFTMTAYDYPEEFGICDGTAEPVPGMQIFQQARRAFALAYVTTLGNDTVYNEYGQKLHLIYGATASPSERAFKSINDSPEAIEFSWECTTVMVDVPGFKPTAEVIIDSTTIPAAKWKQLTEVIFGDGTSEPTLLLPGEIIELLGGSISDATLTALTISGATLTPEFASDVHAYTASVSTDSSTVEATGDTGVTVSIMANGTAVESGGSVTWNDGNNTIIITASKAGSNTSTTIVTVVKS
jgi:hypothetical protein